MRDFDPNHPKIQAGSGGSLWLNFGEYGKRVDVAAFSGDGKYLLTVAEVGTARVWDVASGTLVATIQPSSPLVGSSAGPTTSPFEVFVEAASLSATGDLALLGLNDGTAGVFRVPDGERLSTLHDPEQAPAREWSLVRCVRFSHSGARALVGFADGSVGIWNNTGTERFEFLRPEELERQPGPGFRSAMVCSLDLSDDGRFIFIGGGDLTPLIWDLHERRCVLYAPEHREQILQLRLESRRLLWATNRGSVWSAALGVTPLNLLAAGGHWEEATFSPDGSSLLTRTSESVQRWWPTGGSATLGSITPQTDWSQDVQTLAFDGCGSAFCYPTGAGTLVLQTNSGRFDLECDQGSSPFGKLGRKIIDRVAPVTWKLDRIDQVLFSPDGRLLITRPASSRNVEVWSVSSGKRIGVLHHPEDVQFFAISPDGALLAASTLHHVSASGTYDIHVWSLADRRRITLLAGHEHQVHRIAFGPGNTWIVSSSLDRTVRVWSLERDQPGGQELRRLHREDLDFKNLRVLSDGRLLLFCNELLEVHPPTGEPLRIPIPYSYDRTWAVSPDERSIACSEGAQRVSVWSLESGERLHQYAAPIERPVELPGALHQEIQATSGANLWSGPGGPYLLQGDGPRGWISPLQLSPDRKEVVIPGQADAALVALENPLRLVTRFPFEGHLRTSLILPDRVLLVNAEGKVFVHPR